MKRVTTLETRALISNSEEIVFGFTFKENQKVKSDREGARI